MYILDILEASKFIKNPCVHSMLKTNCNLRDIMNRRPEWVSGDLDSGLFYFVSFFVLNHPANQFGGSH